MYKKFEALGSRLLERFVPKAEAAAAAMDHCGSWSSCPRCVSVCGYAAACSGCCVTGSGCSYVCAC